MRPRWVRRGFRAGRRLVNSRVPPSWSGRAGLEAGLPRAPIPGGAPLCTPHAASASDPLSTTTPAASKKAASRIEPATQLTQAACRGDLPASGRWPARTTAAPAPTRTAPARVRGGGGRVVPWGSQGPSGSVWSSQGRGVGVRPSLPSSSCQQTAILLPTSVRQLLGPGPLPVVRVRVGWAHRLGAG